MTRRRRVAVWHAGTFGRTLRRLLADRGLTPDQLAGHAGLSVLTVREYLSGYRPGWPAVPTLLRVATALDCTIDELLDFTRPSDATTDA